MSPSAFEQLSLPRRQATPTLESGRAGMEPQDLSSRNDNSMSNAVLDEPLRPALTINWWRTLNTIVIFGLGATKIAFTYQGRPMAPNTREWIIVISWILISYWCSIVERESPNTAPWLFKHNPHIPTFLVIGAAPFLFYFASSTVAVCLMSLIVNRWHFQHSDIMWIFIDPLSMVVVGACIFGAVVTIRRWRHGIRHSDAESRTHQQTPIQPFSFDWRTLATWESGIWTLVFMASFFVAQIIALSVRDVLSIYWNLANEDSHAFSWNMVLFKTSYSLVWFAGLVVSFFVAGAACRVGRTLLGMCRGQAFSLGHTSYPEFKHLNGSPTGTRIYRPGPTKCCLIQGFKSVRLSGSSYLGVTHDLHEGRERETYHVDLVQFMMSPQPGALMFAFFCLLGHRHPTERSLSAVVTCCGDVLSAFKAVRDLEWPLAISVSTARLLLRITGPGPVSRGLHIRGGRVEWSGHIAADAPAPG
ncbi:hypothetical protein CVT25_015692 [Psilocybe cyanescens]|uniref:Uncharacterized protein n=1 Tax=Psilocybe cyanescens TaxID=93625 RepID=A0A409XJR9_PSICY|nr:hypothetical protein CVT25_015692 [Psilocybe cyanescens]